jgi:hypothetical protein
VPNLVGDTAEGGARRWGGCWVLTSGDGGRCSAGWGAGGVRGSSRGASTSRCGAAGARGRGQGAL